MNIRKAIEPVKELTHSIRYYLRNNMFAIICVIQALLPGSVFVIGCNIGKESLPWVLIILACQTILSYIKRIMVNIGSGDEVPVPRKRFTQTSTDGEVSVRVDRTQELILYVCDVENYLERKGKLK